MPELKKRPQARIINIGKKVVKGMNLNPYLMLESMLPSMHKVEKKIAKFILEHTEETLSMSVQEMAERINVAESSIVRFSKTVGYNGFSDLKLNLAKASPRDGLVLSGELNEKDDMEAVTRKVFAGNIHSMEHALSLLDFKQIMKIVEQLNRSELVLVFAGGLAAGAAESFCARLISLGIAACAISDTEKMRLSAEGMRRGVAVLSISHAGRTRGMVEAVKAARAAGAYTICICGLPRTPLCDVSALSLQLFSLDMPLLTPLAAQVSLLDSIYAGLAIARRGLIKEEEKDGEQI